MSALGQEATSHNWEMLLNYRKSSGANFISRLHSWWLGHRSRYLARAVDEQLGRWVERSILDRDKASGKVHSSQLYRQYL
jgi:hypothetical protein